ncbi:MAG: VCBS repeat-containing protein [Planctomycetota bacterium]
MAATTKFEIELLTTRRWLGGGAGVLWLTLALLVPARAQVKLFDHVHRMMPARWEYTSALAVGDVDGDHDPDVITGNWDGQLHLDLNDGTGQLSDASERLPAAGDATLALALGDVDGDADRDLVVGNAGGDDRLYLNDGAGNFTDASNQLPAGADYALALALGDVDGDGDPDLVLGNWSLRTKLYVNDGGGHFTDASAQLPQVLDVPALALGDVDGDGDLDLVLSTAGLYEPVTTQDGLLLNDGTGRFSDASAQLPQMLGNTRGIVLRDLDGDGDVDLALGEYWADDRLYVNDGTGHFSDASKRLPHRDDYRPTLSLTAGDVDGDGDLDLVGGHGCYDDCYDGGPTTLYLNDGQGWFSDATDQLPDDEYDPGWALALKDLDGDGDQDLLIGVSAGFALGGQSLLYLNDGKGRFTDVSGHRNEDSGASWNLLALGDVDADGDRDLIVISADREKLLYLNDGTGQFAYAPGHMPRGQENVCAIVLGDVDGDADLDLVEGNAPGSKLFLNDGKGHFTIAKGYLPSNPHDTVALAMGDVDADGDRDLIAGHYGKPSRVFLNDGTGHFTNPDGYLPANPDYVTSLALGDVDRDGDEDLVVVATLKRLYLNDGTGHYVDTVGYVPPYPWSTAVALALGDLDGDGAPELVLGNYGPDALYLNDGTGHFKDATERLPRDSDPTMALLLADLDGDGDNDLLAGNADAPKRLYLNNGRGWFADLSGRLPEDNYSTFDLKAGDLDGDGDTDVVAAARWNLVLTNVGHQLAWRGTPRIGKALTIELTGPPAARWVLYVSAGGSSKPYRLSEDGGPELFVDAGRLDAQGHASHTIHIPADPHLLGERWLWRATIGGVTTTEITTFTDL